MFDTKELDSLIDEEVRYRDMKVHILCNECQAKEQVPFHIFGLKCPKCGSYNTKQIKV
jgi:RING finger/CHY zinc finger protein 1